MPFTRQQKQWIKTRDNQQCQFPIETDGEIHICGATTYLQVHHIQPQRYSYNLGLNPDFAENGITICRKHHSGSPISIHPDAYQASKAQRKGDKKAMKRTHKIREQLSEHGEIYWNNAYDDFLKQRVVINSCGYREPFPAKKKL